MGCDGGTIPKRDELVRTKKKPEQKDKQAELAYRWGHCTITQEPLQKPIVACQLGRLYSKSSVIESILDKKPMPELASHIKCMKDVVEVNLTENPAHVDTAKTSETYDDSLISRFICPVTGLEMNGKFRFVLFWSCGCTVSERAYKEVKVTNCHKCQNPITEEDMIVLNGNQQDTVTAEAQMILRKTKLKLERKNAKKLKNKSGDTEDAASSTSTSNQPTSSIASSSKSTEKSTIPGKRPASAPMDLTDPLMKKTRNEYSVAKDPKATEVYKSLFTSHDSAAKQNRAHWVTYNPFYN